jgi:hypothetical protein
MKWLSLRSIIFRHGLFIIDPPIAAGLKFSILFLATKREFDDNAGAIQ